MASKTNRPVFRFAPSPNGYLHMGHAYSALYCWQMAQKHDGIFLLRIEDIDRERTRHKFINQIFDDLEWLGLKWPEPVLLQSTRFAEYERALENLKEKGLVYPSFLTRKEVRNLPPERDRDPDGAIIIGKKDEPIDKSGDGNNAWRLDLEKAIEYLDEVPSFTECASGPKGETGRQKIEPGMWGNIILARKNTATSYHLSVVIDDAFQNITHVTRGHDLYYATHIHILLQKLLELPTPSYTHHPLINDQEGRKLSKSAMDKSLKSLREEGVKREEIIALFNLEA